MMNFARIVAATDLSACSAAALEYATRIAGAFGSEITLVHANTIAPLIDGVPGSLAYAAEWQLEGARTALEGFAEKHLADFAGAQRVVVTGAAADVILSSARSVDADLIVMGTRGATGIERVLLGSVAET
jgi:nucleotide-binding universal stress UspA family protein